MVKRALLFVLALGLTGSTLIGSDVSTGRAGLVPARDTNRRAVNTVDAEAAARRVFDKVMSRADVAAGLVTAVGAPGDLCAVGVVPGPAASFNIRFNVFNLLGEEVGNATLDSFLALGGNALVHESVFAPAGPAGGTQTVEYPKAGGGRGPVVLSFTGFGALNAVAFNTDPDTYDDPAFGTTVAELNRTVIELAYAGGRRCRGVFVFNGAASIALITQTSP